MSARPTTAATAYSFLDGTYDDTDFTYTVTDSVLNDNGNSGLYIYSNGAPTGVIENTDMSGNYYYGIYTDMYRDGSSLIVRGSTINDNGEYGVYFCDMSGVTLIEDTTIDGNGYTGIYGALYSGDSGQLTLLGSTVSNNNDGGIYLYTYYPDTTIDIINSTISGNDGDDYDEAAIAFYGDSAGDSQATILHSTVTANTKVWTGLSSYGMPVFVSHSIISGNDVLPEYADVYAGSDSPIEIEWSIVTVAAEEPLVIDSGIDTAAYIESEGVVESADPKLGPLADNGGATLTHLPLDESAAIDGGNPDVTGEPNTDQRGEARVSGAAIDIGAVEVPLEDELAATGAAADAALAAALALLIGGLGLVGFRTLRRRATV